MEVSYTDDGNDYRYDDEVNHRGIGLVVKALRGSYPFIIGYRMRKVSITVFIELKVDCSMLRGAGWSGREIHYLENFDESLEEGITMRIKERVEGLYKVLPDEFVNHYWVKYSWNDKGVYTRSGIYVSGFYCK